ncbi:hypothetical protein RvY_01335-2 [Ramazzottius varieornatus]|uniref:Peptidase M12A domain-containing protein n=1 Tax=Ramazzottius varieornatus TaxID=947166 RepID=A0A1D1UGB5_RAMVA|nr:hypothetical protein RvY_01335-2 [Ramazzottius varieornatus]
MATSMSVLLAVGLWFAVIRSYSCAKHRFKRTYNVDPSFSIWPNKSRILYYLDSDYSDSERNLIKAGITQIMSQLQGCINFVETTASDTNFKIRVTPFDANGTLQDFCWSYQGQRNFLRNTGALEQPLIITRGPNGCLDGSLHNIMKYFAICLGKRNEHQRGDRDKMRTGCTTPAKPCGPSFRTTSVPLLTTR